MVNSRRKALEGQLVLLASREGWTYEPIRERLASGFRMRTDRWQLESIARSSDKEAGPGSSETCLETCWQADLPGPVVLIGGRTPRASLGEAGKFLSRQVLRMALGDEATGLTEVQVGGSNLLRRYMVWAQEPRYAEALLHPAVLSLLVNWQGREPLVKRAENRLSIQLRGQKVNKPGELLQLVRLGEALLAAGGKPERG